MSDKKKILKKISVELAKAYAEHGEPVARNLADVTPEIFQADLARWGMAIIKNPVSDAEWAAYLQMIICELSEHLFANPEPTYDAEYAQELEKVEKNFPNDTAELQMLRAFGKWWNSSSGFGNSNFRFLYFQFQEHPPHFDIGDHDITFSRNPFHRWALRLLASESKLWEILKSFHPPHKAMVSWDSAKVRINHPKATKPALTKRHRDVYNYDGQPLDRKQAMLINQEQGAIALGWVLYSHLPKVQKLLAEYLGYQPNKFSSVENPDLNKIIDKYWRATSEQAFVVWEQATIHYEAQPSAPTADICKFQSFTQPAAIKNKVSIRVVIGTHQPYNLDQEELTQLAFLVEKGFAPAVYNNPNKGTAIAVNTVNKKGTQWRKTREPATLELEELQQATDDYSHAPKQVVTMLPKILQEMYGLY